MRKNVVLYALLSLFLSSSFAFAQNANDMLNIFGGLMRSSMTQATRTQWEKLPSNEIACVDQTLRQRGASLQSIIVQGVTPSDSRIFAVLSACRTKLGQLTASPVTSDATSLFYVANTNPPDPYLALRTEPSAATGQRIMKMRNGTSLQVLQRRDDDWWYVRVVQSGQEGWALSGQGNSHWIVCCASASAGGAIVAGEGQSPTRTYWNLNGSIVYLVANGTTREFYFQEPSKDLRDLGATSGSLLFSGKAVNGSSYEGTVYVFNHPCEKVQYKATGPILDDYSRVVIEGEEPLIDPDCHEIGYKHGKLEFKLLKPQPLIDATLPQGPKEQQGPGPGQQLPAAMTAQEQAANNARAKEIDDAKATGANTDPEVQAAIKKSRDEIYTQTQEAYRQKDYARMRDLGERLRIVGDIRGDSTVGLCYLRGLGVSADEKKGVELTRNAANHGWAPAEVNLGVAYLDGTGVPKDDAAAIDLLKKAAEQQYVGGQALLGWAYLNGRGVAKDEVQAVDWFKKAADQGDAFAQQNLGTAYLHGIGVAKDTAKAATWLQKAADKGSEIAKKELTALVEVADAEKNGVEYAQESGTSWSIKRTKNEMTDKVDVTVQSVQKNDNDVVAEIEGKCLKPGIVTFSALIVDQDGKPTVDLPTYSQANKMLFGTRRINANTSKQATFVGDQFRNRFLALVLIEKASSIPQLDVRDANSTDPGKIIEALPEILLGMRLGLADPQSVETTWRALVEVQTSANPILIKIPLFDRNIRSLIDSCKAASRS